LSHIVIPNQNADVSSSIDVEPPNAPSNTGLPLLTPAGPARRRGEPAGAQRPVSRLGRS
jgi:hypothetical protein